MIPQIVNLGPLPVNSFGLMIALAIFAAIYRLSKSFVINGIDPQEAERITIFAALSGLIGARLWYVIEHFSLVKDDLTGALLSGAGFTFYGGFVLATLTVILVARQSKISLSALADSVGPALALGYAIGRLGCQLSGDGDYGKVTDSWIGMSYISGVVPSEPGVLHLPTPLFESALALGVLWVLNLVERREEWQVPLRRFGLYLLLISAERFVIEFWRLKPKYTSLGLSEAHFVSLLLMMIGLSLVIRRRTAPSAPRS